MPAKWNPKSDPRTSRLVVRSSPTGLDFPQPELALCVTGWEYKRDRLQNLSLNLSYILFCRFPAEEGHAKIKRPQTRPAFDQALAGLSAPSLPLQFQLVWEYGRDWLLNLSLSDSPLFSSVVFPPKKEVPKSNSPQTRPAFDQALRVWHLLLSFD